MVSTLNAPHSRTDRSGTKLDNLWFVRSFDDDITERYQSLEDLDATTLPNATIIRVSNLLFVHKQQAGTLDLPPEEAQLENLAEQAYYEIFGFRPSTFYKPDVQITNERALFIPEVHGWGRSPGHSRMAGQADFDERVAIGQFTGIAIPATPAQAAGGRANRGGYYPDQSPKGKGGRSAPYPTPSSSSASGTWWSSSNWWGRSGWGSWWS